MPLELRCRDGIHMVAVDEDIVVLDVRADRYSAIPGAAGAILCGPHGSLLVDDPGTAEALVAAHLATRQSSPMLRRRAEPAASELPISATGQSGRSLIAFAALSAAALSFRRKTLAELTAPLSWPGTPHIAASARPGEQTAPPERLLRVLSDAAAVLPWIPHEGACLKRSFQLRQLFARHDLAVDWVFGVRTWPFAAHCWLQYGDLVVGDRLARVGRYTPIMVV